MPSRPRQHQLSEESRKAFEAALPSSWVFRVEQPDYGIDGSVELFDDSGNTTGLRFFLQLEATDNSNENVAKQVRVRLDTAAYYKKLDLPVLIVSYHSPTKTLFARWFDEFDPYYGGVGKEFVLFSLNDDNRWNDNTPSEIQRDPRQRRRIRQGGRAHLFDRSA